MSGLTSRPTWASRLSFILATSGAAVGLGNIWKFPYVMADNGGALFLFLYLAAIVLMGLPIMTSEIALGKLGRANAVDTLKTLARRYGASQWWSSAGYLGLLTLGLVLSFYSVIAGWSLAYILQSLRGDYLNASANEIAAQWNLFLSTPLWMTLFHGLFMVLTCGVLAFGVNRGIERASKIMMPALFVMLFFLAGYGLWAGETAESLRFFLQPDWQQLNIGMVLDAVGQAFFTLAIGAGCMLVYGAYLAPEEPIVRSTIIIAGLDVLVAILAGLAIFPIIFAYQLPIAQGPDLMFKVLPMAFSHMPAGQFIGLSFFVLLLFAAWTSSISMAEPLIVMLTERTRCRRPLAALIVGVLVFSMGLISILAIATPLSTYQLFNRWGILDLIITVPTNVLLPLGGLSYVLFAAWKTPKADMQQALGLGRKAFVLWQLLARWVAPAGILWILLNAGLS